MEDFSDISPDTIPPTPRLIQVAEHSLIPLQRGELLDLQTGNLLLSTQIIGRNYIRVQADKNQVVVHAGPYIGLLPLNEHVTLEIVPRVPIANLVRVLAASNRAPQRLPDVLRTYATQAVPIEQIRDELAEALLNQVRLIGATGLHYVYTSTQEDTSFPKGRILLQATITRLLARGKRYLARTTRFERDFDTRPNQLLKLALMTLATSYRVGIQPNQTIKQLADIREALVIFTKVATLSIPTSQLVDLFNQLPPTRAYYNSALELAQLVLGTRGVDFDSSTGSVHLPSMLWKMDDLFEDYIRWSLHQHFLTPEISLEVADGNLKYQVGGGAKPLFTKGPDTRLANPDIVVMKLNTLRQRIPLAVFDVKYKPKKPEREDLNQVLAYALSYQVSVVGIISLAMPNEPSCLTLLGEISSVQVYHYAFQLGEIDLAKEEEKLANALFALMP